MKVCFHDTKILLLKVPGRMGLLVTTSLIVWNVYGSTKAPSSRGFSNIELWITGVQCVINFGILEYACILTLKRSNPIPKFDLNEISKITDIISFMVSLIFFVMFNVIYWYKNLV